jgi:phage recombination protein Bet
MTTKPTQTSAPGQQIQAAAPQAQQATEPSKQVPEVWRRFSEVLGVSAGEARSIIVNTIMPGAKDADVLAFISVASEYKLNPVLKQIYAFPNKKGGISPMVSIDGWIALVQRHPLCNGVDFAYDDRNNKPYAVTCIIQRKGWDNPVRATEYLEECVRDTDPWKQSPRRMLRHRAFIQCARLAFGFGGLTDEEELAAQSGAGAPAAALPPREAEFETLTRAMEKPVEAALAQPAKEQQKEQPTQQAAASEPNEFSDTQTSAADERNN